MFMLKGERPDKFKERTEHTGPNGGPLQLSAIPADEIDRELKKLERLNNGDNPDTKEYSYKIKDSYKNDVKYGSWSWIRDDWTVQNFDKLTLVVDKTIELGNKQRAN
jgi:hypothetical protein